MPLIGVIAKENDSNFIKNELNRNACYSNFEVININKKSIENVKNIKFDIILIKENVKEFFENSNYLESIVEKANFLIINSDIEDNKNIPKCENKNIIKFGFSSNASITISSIRDENIMICIQNKFEDINNQVIEEQENLIKIEKNNMNKLYNVLAIFTIFLIYGEELVTIYG